LCNYAKRQAEEETKLFPSFPANLAPERYWIIELYQFYMALMEYPHNNYREFEAQARFLTPTMTRVLEKKDKKSIQTASAKVLDELQFCTHEALVAGMSSLTEFQACIGIVKNFRELLAAASVD
jgi:hypothetical protein